MKNKEKEEFIKKTMELSNDSFIKLAEKMIEILISDNSPKEVIDKAKKDLEDIKKEVQDIKNNDDDFKADFIVK